LIRYVALAYVAILVIGPAGLILWRWFAPGMVEFFAWISTVAAISALQLSLFAVAIVVQLNVIFSVPTALVLACNRFRGKDLVQAVIDLPFAISPVIVAVALIRLWGSAWDRAGQHLRYVSVRHQRGRTGPARTGTDQEEAAATLDSRWWQTFWRIMLPFIRWGLMCCVVPTIARTLDEFGAVIMVSSNLPGSSQTLPLLV
jgi:sulfate transport system permease protein